MSGEKCSMKNCSNKKGLNKITFFSFPKKHTERYNQWIELAGCNKDKIDRKSFSFLCSNHFEDKMFVNAYFKKRLKPDAIPISYKEVLPAKDVLTNHDNNEVPITISNICTANKALTDHDYDKTDSLNKVPTEFSTVATSLADTNYNPSVNNTLKTNSNTPVILNTGSSTPVILNTFSTSVDNVLNPNYYPPVNVMSSNNMLNSTYNPPVNNGLSPNFNPPVNAILNTNFNPPVNNTLNANYNNGMLLGIIQPSYNIVVSNPSPQPIKEKKVSVMDFECQTPPSISMDRQKIKSLKTKIASSQQQVRRLRLKLKVINDWQSKCTLEDFHTLCDKFLDPKTSEFVKIQSKLNLKKPQGKRYSEDFKKSCSELFFKSPNSYKELSKIFHLPNETTLRRRKRINPSAKNHSNKDQSNEDLSREDQPNEDQSNEDQSSEDQPNEDQSNKDQSNENLLNLDQIKMEDELII